MQEKGVRRIPVVDARGALVGILAIDDLLEVARNSSPAWSR
jgi:CBS domain-containing protein